VPDECDVAGGSLDCDANGVPDECEPDCNGNGMADSCDIAGGSSADCNSNWIPDDCELELAILFPFDSDPGWSTLGQWAFGPPTGGGSHNHDPLAAYTGQFVYGYNLAGDYTNNLLAADLTTPAFDFTGISNVELRFWRWLGVQAAPQDRARVSVSSTARAGPVCKTSTDVAIWHGRRDDRHRGWPQPRDRDVRRPWADGCRGDVPQLEHR
jgi:hypothetical protein